MFRHWASLPSQRRRTVKVMSIVQPPAAADRARQGSAALRLHSEGSQVGQAALGRLPSRSGYTQEAASSVRLHSEGCQVGQAALRRLPGRSDCTQKAARSVRLHSEGCQVGQAALRRLPGRSRLHSGGCQVGQAALRRLPGRSGCTQKAARSVKLHSDRCTQKAARSVKLHSDRCTQKAARSVRLHSGGCQVGSGTGICWVTGGSRRDRSPTARGPLIQRLITGAAGYCNANVSLHRHKNTTRPRQWGQRARGGRGASAVIAGVSATSRGCRCVPATKRNVSLD